MAVTLADPRGWTGGAEWRLQRVGPDSGADLTVLHGCAPNAWPQVDGVLHTGPPGQYDDPIPAED